MISFASLFAFGTWLLQQQATLPELRWAWLLVLPLPALRLPQQAAWQRILHRVSLLLLALFAGYFHAAWMAQQRLADELPAAWQGRDIQLAGVVAEMPRQHEHGQSFAFDVEQTLTPEAHVPRRILLSTYTGRNDAPLDLHAGERWQFTVRLKQPHGTSNPHTFDFEVWALERNLRAMGYVHQRGDNRRIDEHAGHAVERLREAIRSRFQQVLGSAPYGGVITALAIGDQASIPASQWQVFTRTGVNHLMSISGLHITMLAGMAFALCYWLWRRSTALTLWLPARKAAALAGFAVALAYALLAGYGVPAQRTVYMLGTVAAALWLSRNVAPSQLLSAALLVVLVLDPWAVLSAGFWLSFGAVALIFYITANRLGSRHWAIEYGRMQWAMTIGLIPPLLALFQQLSLVSPLANAFAIPLVSFVVVPLTLLGALLPLDGLLQLAHLVMSGCMLALQWLNQLPLAVWTQHAPPAWSIVLGVIGVVWLLLPRGFPSRWLGGLLLLPMFLVQPEPPAPASVRLTIFDVGQGLAVSAHTRQHALLFDSGPEFNSEANSGNRILVPSLRGMGIARLDTLLLSHDDADHTGGALSILQAMPVASVLSSLPDDSPILQQAAHVARCSDGQRWEWDGVQFELLHPATTSYAEDDSSTNNHGCVLRISVGTHSVLIAADIEKESERRLLQRHADKLRATLLVVPHHGSKTSSTPDFVAAVQPRYAVFTAGYRNRFGHPKAEVVERYQAIGSTLLRSDEDGAILVEMDAQQFTVARHRQGHVRYWQQSPRSPAD